MAKHNSAIFETGETFVVPEERPAIEELFAAEPLSVYYYYTNEEIAVMCEQDPTLVDRLFVIDQARGEE